jgi:hypothetical protein
MTASRTRHGFDAESENVRVAIEEDWDLPEPPYFYSPYPDRLVQVHIPETDGGQEVAKLINSHWPVSIVELETISREKLEDGYSGSFIRSVLRSNYIPEDKARMEESESESSWEVSEPEKESEVARSMEDVDEEWHQVFRMGIRAALQSNIDEQEAFVAFESGFIEGEKLKKEF